jgi:dTDP-glucose 4,6-dehydratase
MSEVLEEDFKYIVESKLPWTQLKDKVILITGGSGFIGSLLIKTLNYINNEKNLNIKILTIIRNEEHSKKILNGCEVTLITGDICDIIQIDSQIDYIIHCAAITKSKEMIEKPVQVIEGIVNGTQNIMKLAKQKNVRSVVYLSSMEVYGKTNPSLESVDESELGYIDLLNPRSCYPLSKRMAENICFSYFYQYNLPVKIARLAQTFGAGILKNENRVFAQFAKSAIKGQNIVLHTTGDSVGNYCYTADAIKALFTLLLKGENGQAYNISNENTNMTIKQMAELVAKKIANDKISVKFDVSSENSYIYPEPVKMKLSTKKISELGWKAKYDMEEMYYRMIKELVNSKDFFGG